ncbi:MAG: Endoribonuclease YbeY [Alphaproteobacteria bacterium MarineAlpha5_Bin11]|nr:rRNA maturation RNase YbeY [Pelagibacteraceae bacterium]PPR45145.1 MAG: Endoribonuclease YbeY [Alphaproteobacteria bacterium MarineAlpha5_Bin11]PPR52117.1 MAG: Endoribonuclease YbeY [Alphaproteobacteria bacterium MarineAlpha5_Bin10]|tara:strand:+ start:9296 stop:9811 length:516 start_codon:yes stop_codon:yes gene_type:complete
MLIINNKRFNNKISYSIINESKLWSKRAPRVKKIINLVLKKSNYFINKKFSNYIINFLLTDNKGIKYFNRIYRRKHNATDVLAFISEKRIDKYVNLRFCDIVLSGQIIKKNSKKIKIDFYDHLTHIIIHALLHSNGYKHGTKKERNIMQNREIMILKELKIENPYQYNEKR